MFVVAAKYLGLHPIRGKRIANQLCSAAETTSADPAAFVLCQAGTYIGILVFSYDGVASKQHSKSMVRLIPSIGFGSADDSGRDDLV